MVGTECVTCAASLACLVGGVRSVFKCKVCGDTWAFVFLPRPRKEVTASSLLTDCRSIPISNAHFRACPKYKGRHVRYQKVKYRDGECVLLCAKCDGVRKELNKVNGFFELFALRGESDE